MSYHDVLKTKYQVTQSYANDYVGRTGQPSKMRGIDGPIRTMSTSAKRCNVGSKLREVSGSVCENCYANKNQYLFPDVVNAMEARYQALTQPHWVPMMAIAIGNGKEKRFRWDDSGDLQSMNHLIRIVAVAMLRPDMRFWLPTREYALISEYRRRGGYEPENLTIRLSHPMVGGRLPARAGLSSMVLHHDQQAQTDVHECPAPTQDGACNACNACWRNDVAVVAYREH